MEEVVCTGIGIISPAGINKQTFWHSIIEGTDHDIALPDSKDLSFFKNEKPIIFSDDNIWMVKKLKRKTYTTRISELALAAAVQALHDASFEVTEYNPTKIGVVVGTGYGNLTSQNEVLEKLLRHSPKAISPRYFSRVIHNEPAGVLAIELNLQGVNTTVSQGEASGEIALCCAVQFLKTQQAETIIVIGIDEYHPMIHEQYDEEKEISSFDFFRKDTIPGEGAGAILLETKKQARNRSAFIYGQIDDFSIRYNDITSSINEALNFAGILRKQVDCVISATDGSPFRNNWERKGLKQALGEDAYFIPIISIVPIIGHFPGSGVIRTAASLLVIQDGSLPLTFNLKDRDPDCDLDCVPKLRLTGKTDYVLQSCFVPSSSTVSIIIRNAKL